MVSHAVTKGLNPDVPMKDSGVEWLGNVPEHWEVLSFSRFTRLSQGLQIPQSDRLEQQINGAVEYITIRSINAGAENTQKEYIQSPSQRVICNRDDVLLARTGATGEVVTGVEGVFHNNFFKVSYDHSIDKDFLVHLLQVRELKQHLLMLAGTTTIPDLNHGAFLSTKVPLPSKSEQKKIVAVLREKIARCDSVLRKNYDAIRLLRERRTALISAAVTGKIDVRDWVAPRHAGC
ncbi:TPA: restriction endonuclease subunit S [Klebsiella pneumoniae]|nr:restriction endonuclease subunit S [Klebsiella pneumoniae]